MCKILRDFVAPPNNLDSWPGSIPEAEQLLTLCVLHELNAGNFSKEYDRFLTSSAWRVRLIVPSAACVGRWPGFPLYALMNMADSNPLMTWAVLPSTREIAGQPLGYFSRSLYGQAANWLEKQLSRAEELKEVQQNLEMLAKIGVKAAGAVVLGPAVAAVLPGLPPGAANVIGVAVEEITLNIAKGFARGSKRDGKHPP
jgi:hypothetical protein